jgi:phospholipid N-methyltransferase
MPRPAEWIAFVKEFRRTFHTTGAVLPSSRFLARKIARHIKDSPSPARILEVGPGTGAFTGEILRQLRPGDELLLVELNDRFVEILRDRLASDPAWKQTQGRVTLRHGSALDLGAAERFHLIICGLPFNNFDPNLVERLTNLFLDRLEPGGCFSFFEYLGLRRLKSAVVGAKEKARLAKIEKIIAKLSSRCRSECDRVLRNVPPATVHHLRPNSSKRQ